VAVISVVIPVFNEQQCLPALMERLLALQADSCGEQGQEPRSNNELRTNS
jgi:hypothetical protein